MQTETPEGKRLAEIGAFLQKDYDHKIGYLKDHFSRMWTRFNYFIGIETAITGGKILWAGGEVSVDWFSWLGMIVSVFWYMMGAQDRYLSVLYRKQVEEAGNRLAEHLGIPQYTPVGKVSDVRKFDFKSLAEWRSKVFTTTRLAAWVPLVVTLLWVALAVGTALASR